MSTALYPEPNACCVPCRVTMLFEDGELSVDEFIAVSNFHLPWLLSSACLLAHAPSDAAVAIAAASIRPPTSALQRCRLGRFSGLCIPVGWASVGSSMVATLFQQAIFASLAKDQAGERGGDRHS
mmetsp:Transcript_36827/g.68578  ORF Transcript_36827/g.68578 Transcript_36827/m.68578 type:complete len:125 (-) Transcript_36827:16-390(-)